METSDIRVFSVHKDLIISCELETKGFNEKVDLIWEEIKKKKNLYEGTFFNVHSITDTKIHGQFVPYRYFVAINEDKTLAQELNLLPMGISCITQWQDLILVGKRSVKVYSYPGLYEFVPSGSIDEGCKENTFVDYKKQARIEFYEETTLDPSLIASITPFVVLQSKTELFCDLCLRIELIREYKPDFIDHTQEYDELRWINVKEVDAFLYDHQKNLVPKQSIFWDKLKGEL